MPIANDKSVGPVTSLIVMDYGLAKAELTQAAQTLKTEALAKAAPVQQVTNADENALAVEAQQAMQTLISAVEKARVEIKAPILKAGRAVDSAAQTFIDSVNTEMARVSKMVGSYLALEQKRQQAAEQARNANLTALERERAEMMALATTEADQDYVAEHYSNLAAAASVPIEASAREDGQRIAQDWEVAVTDIWLLARAHSVCVKIEPRISEIKNLLRLGVKVQGVTATPVVKAGVRTTGQKAIEV